MHWSFNCVRKQRVAFHRILGHASGLCKQRSRRLEAESQTIPLRSVLFPAQWELFGWLRSVCMHWVQNVRVHSQESGLWALQGYVVQIVQLKWGIICSSSPEWIIKRSIHKAFLDGIVPARLKVIWMHLWVWWVNVYVQYVGKSMFENVLFIVSATFLIYKKSSKSFSHSHDIPDTKTCCIY